MILLVWEISLKNLGQTDIKDMVEIKVALSTDMAASTSYNDGGFPQLSQYIPTTHICCDFLQYHSKKSQTACQPLIEILQ